MIANDRSVDRVPSVGVPAVSARCPVCGQPAAGALRSCARCDTPHHADCFGYAGGCAIFGCEAGSALERIHREVWPEVQDRLGRFIWLRRAQQGLLLGVLGTLGLLGLGEATGVPALIVLGKLAVSCVAAAYFISIPVGNRAWDRLVRILDEARSWEGQLSTNDPRFRLPARASDLSQLVSDRFAERFAWWTPRLYVAFVFVMPAVMLRMLSGERWWFQVFAVLGWLFPIALFVSGILQYGAQLGEFRTRFVASLAPADAKEPLPAKIAEDERASDRVV